MALRIGGAKEGERVAEPPLERRGDLPLGGVGGLERNDVGMDLDSERKNSFLPLEYLGELQDISVESIQGNVELRRARSKQRYHYRRVIVEAL